MKTIQILLVAFFATIQVQAQGIMLAGGAVEEAGEQGLLDDYPGASAAYSLRSLSSTYTGPVVEVRRSSDNATQDFTADEVSTIAGWVGAGNDGFVRTWYDQSGNGNDAVQTNAANQPKIVDSGNIVQKNGKASMSFDGSNDYLNVNSAFTTDVNLSAFTVASTNSNSSNNFLYDNSNVLTYGGGYSCRFNSAGSISIWSQDATSALVIAGAVLNTYQYLISQISTNSGGENNTLYQDGTQVGNNSGSPKSRSAKLNTYIGASQIFGGYLNGQIQELIAYPSNQSTNRTGIESNINTYYNIY